MNIFKMFGLKKEHKGVPHEDIPEFIPHPHIPDVMMRNPELTAKKHGGVIPPGEVPLGEGTTAEEHGGTKFTRSTYAPDIKEAKRDKARRK